MRLFTFNSRRYTYPCFDSSPTSVPGSPAGMGGHTAGVARHEFVGTAKRAGATHALFLKDPHEAWYLRAAKAASSTAFGGDGNGDEYANVTAVVAQEVRRLRPRRLVTIGASMGGYAAVRVGLALGADAVLAFGPQVVFCPLSLSQNLR